MKRFMNKTKSVMIILIPVLIFVLIYSIFLVNISKKNDASIFVTTDIHYLSPGLTDGGEAYQIMLAAGDGRQLNYIEQIVVAFSDKIIRESPDVLIVSGDLTFNGEKESHMKLAEKFKSIESNGKTSILVIPGNHDIQNPWARGFKGAESYPTETITANDFKLIYNAFGFDDVIAEDSASLSYLTAVSDKLWILMLDTNLYTETYAWPITSGLLKDETIKWIEDCGQKAILNNAKLMVVMHHNLLDHNVVLNSGFTIENNEEIIELFKRNKIEVVLSGHAHIQDIKLNGDGNQKIYDILSSALSVFPVQYGVLNYSNINEIKYETRLVDVEEWAVRNNINDPNLLNFNAYSENYFIEFSSIKAFSELNGLKSYDKKTMKIMAQTMGIINANYFSGTIRTIKNKVTESEGYKLWLSAKPSFIKEYVLSMLHDEGELDNYILIKLNSFDQQ